MTKWSLLLPFFRKHRARLSLTFLAGIVSSITTILMPMCIGHFYRLVFDFRTRTASFFDSTLLRQFDTLEELLAAFTLLLVINLATGFMQRFMVFSMGELLAFELRNKLFDHQLKLDPSVYLQKGVGKYLLRYSGDLKSIQNYLTKGLVGFTIDVLLISMVVVALAMISPVLTTIAFIALCLIGIPIYLLNKGLHSISTERRNRKSNLLSFVSKRLEAVHTIKAFNRVQPELAKFMKHSTRVYKTGLSFHRLSTFIYVLVPALLYAMIGVIMYAIHVQKANGTPVDHVDLLTAFLLIMSMLPVLRRTLRVMVTWKLGMISINKLLNVLKLPSEERLDGDDLAVQESIISMENVSLSFGENRVFDPLNAEWKGHGLHLILGGTGSGKSCLAKLLLGLHSEYEGTISIDHQDIRSLTIKSLRKHVTIISDEFPLLGNTVFEAISYSRKEVKRKGAERWLNTVQEALPFEARLSLDDRIGAKGKALSKGQERVLLFTRALLTRKPILLIDEPFYNMEPTIQAHLTKLIMKLKNKRTVLLFLKNYHREGLSYDSLLDLDEQKSGSGSKPSLKLSA